MIDLSGIFPPIPTAFNSDETIAPDKLIQNLTRLSEYDLAGFLVLGSNGEQVMLTEKERVQVFEAAREAIPGDKLMLAGTGAQSTGKTIELSRAAADIGADAVLVLNPSYYKGQMTKAALVQHFSDVADESEVPVIVYNMPACSGLDMSADTIAAVSQHPNIVGIKDSGGNLAKLAEVIRTASPGFQFLSGSASVILAALTMGAVGGILALANIAPGACLDIYHHFKNDEIDRAREMQTRMMPVIAAVTSIGGVPALKTAMDYLGLYGGPARKPTLPLSESEKTGLIALLNDNDIKL